jgi:hypothetical protein
MRRDAQISGKSYPHATRFPGGGVIMAKSPNPGPTVSRASPATVFRKQIEAAVMEGAVVEDMTLRLTLGDAHKIKRDTSLALEDISFADGQMRFLGVKVEQGGVPASALDL